MYKSKEEQDFADWLDEAKENGLIHQWEYEPRSFILFDKQTFKEKVQLKTKTKIVERHLHAEASYTPDFMMELTNLGEHLLFDAFKSSILSVPVYVRATTSTVIWVDVKGNFDPIRKDPRFFSLIQKAIYRKHGVWVAKVVPFYQTGKGKEKWARGLFTKTFAPQSCRWISGRKVPTLSVCGKACCGVGEFVNASMRVSE